MTKLHIGKRSRRLLVALLLILLVIVAVIALHIHNVHNAQHKSGSISAIKVSPPKASSATKSTSNSSSATTPQTSSSTAQKDPEGAGQEAGSSTAVTMAPYGSFVSNHRPGQNGSPTQEQSQCITTPGASCYIQFVKDGVTKKLDAKTADGSGNVTWNWDVKGSDLEPGSWQISAVATLNGQTKTTIDPNGNLEIN